MLARSFVGCKTSTVELVLPILDEAAQELDAALGYLEAEGAGSGRALLAAFDRKLDQILMFPESGPRVLGTPDHYMIRAFPLSRFRYSIIVGLIDSVPTIIAFVHQSREPGYWLDRLDLPR
jgi:toxin ParE1/3/4